MKGIIREAGDLITFFRKTNKLYLLPFVLLLIILALFVVFASASPIPVFLYPII